jgi:dTDP-4-amino-4,6-dideoxygalactose transaminase
MKAVDAKDREETPSLEVPLSIPFVPFNRFCGVGTEFKYIQHAIDVMQIAGDGRFTKRCQSLLEEVLSVPKVLLTTSCTHALEMAAMLLNIQPGDEVIVPSFTFVSTANAFALRGARLIFCDIRPDTLNLDETLLEGLFTTRTRAIVPVHYAGVGCEMDEIMRLANERGVPVVEDNAHGLFGKYRGRYLGTFGAMATQSFHETKNFTCGEGGALLINAIQYGERAEILREKGTDRSRFFRGLVDKYRWVDIGSSFPPSDILAAVLYAQLEARGQVQAIRGGVWTKYKEELSQWALEHGVSLPFSPPHCEHPFHIFYLLMPSPELRDSFIEHLKARGILSVFHYLPLHNSPMGKRFGGRDGQCPISESVSDRLVRLPLFNGLTEDAQQRVIRTVIQFRT